MGHRNLGGHHMGLTGTLGIHGRLSLTAVDSQWFDTHRTDTALMQRPPDKAIRDRREGDNLMCTAGLTALAGALVYSGIQDVAPALGVTTGTYLTPLWGAVGSGTGTVAASDTLLWSELGRQQVGAGASAPATGSLPALFTWLFYFPSPASVWTVTEAALFANGSSNPADVTTAGVMLDHWAVTPPLTVPTTDSLILQASFSLAGV